MTVRRRLLPLKIAAQELELSFWLRATDSSTWNRKTEYSWSKSYSATLPIRRRKDFLALSCWPRLQRNADLPGVSADCKRDFARVPDSLTWGFGKIKEDRYPETEDGEL